MRIGVLGAGGVGRTIGNRLIDLGHEVMLGSRVPDNPVAAEWAAGRSAARSADFAAAADFADLLINATPGLVSEEVLVGIGDAALAGTTLLDLSNPLDFSAGFPPVVRQPDGVSLAERLQAAVPSGRVVKALNMMTADVMLDPGLLSEPTTAFIAGDDAAAKDQVADLLTGAGWLPEQVVDLGGLVAARGMELYLPLWLSLFATLGTANLNIRLVR